MEDSQRLANLQRLIVKYGVDLLGWTLVTPLAFFIRLDDVWVNYGEEMLVLGGIGLFIKALVLYVLGFHRRSWHRVGVRDLFVLIQGVLFVTLVMAAVAFFLPENLSVPRGIPLIEGMLALLGLSGTRLVFRLTHEQWRHRANGGASEARRVLIVGAGEAGTMIAREMIRHPEARRTPVGFLDDDPSKQRNRFLGLRVLGRIDDLPQVTVAHEVDEVLIAMPSQSGEIVRRIVGLARQVSVKHRIIPGIYELLSGDVSIGEIREVDLEDLLRREPVRLNVSSIKDYIADQVVLVTGAGGSIGSEIVRQVARFGPAQVILLGRGENSIYEIERECRQHWKELRWCPVITDVRDREKLAHVFETYRPNVVFHAAAHKHVPMMEANPDEAVLNNVGGTKNLVELALEHGVSCFVNISTDKAVRPTSIMGASKRVAEYLVEWASRQTRGSQCFVSVRFGNVLGSRGSVVPLFREQIRRGGPITVTHPEMQRYFMTIPEAVQLVLQAGGLKDNGNVYVLDMGDPVKIVDLARDLIELSGLTENDVPITFTGMRPGEKLFEELLTSEEGTDASHHEKIYVARKHGLPDQLFESLVEELILAARSRNAEYIREVFKEIIPSNMLPEAEVSQTQTR